MATGENGVANSKLSLGNVRQALISFSDPESRQAQQSDLAKSLLTQRIPSSVTTPMAADTANIPEIEPGNLVLPGSALPQLCSPQTTLLAPPAITGLGRALQTGFYNGAGRALNDTPLGSAPSTASNSPRL